MAVFPPRAAGPGISQSMSWGQVFFFFFFLGIVSWMNGPRATYSDHARGTRDIPVSLLGTVLLPKDRFSSAFHVTCCKCAPIATGRDRTGRTDGRDGRDIVRSSCIFSSCVMSRVSGRDGTDGTGQDRTDGQNGWTRCRTPCLASNLVAKTPCQKLRRAGTKVLTIQMRHANRMMRPAMPNPLPHRILQDA